MKKIALAAAAASLMFVGADAASAADMAPRYAKAPPPVVAPIYNWTGFYIGGEVGGRWSEGDWTTTCLQPGLAATCAPSAFPARFAFNNPSSYDSSGVKGGVYGGYNWQVSSWVVGVEGDFLWGDNKKTKAGIPGANDPAVAGSPGLDSSSIRQTWDASLRGRVGVLVSPSILLFGTGGVAFTHVESSAFCGTAFPVGWCTPANVPRLSTASKDLTGWTVGAGVEAMLTPNWLLRGEYRYADYGTFGSTVLAGPVTNVDAVAFDTKLRTHSATIGLAYKFGGPVVAKY
jgi:outer membrane immunogenic protein